MKSEVCTCIVMSGPGPGTRKVEKFAAKHLQLSSQVVSRPKFCPKKNVFLRTWDVRSRMSLHEPRESFDSLSFAVPARRFQRPTHFPLQMQVSVSILDNSHAQYVYGSTYIPMERHEEKIERKREREKRANGKCISTSVTFNSHMCVPISSLRMCLLHISLGENEGGSSG